MYKRLGMMRGVNLGGWLSQCNYSTERLMNFITEADFARIASWGLDHVRLPIDYPILQNKDGSFRTEGFERLDFAFAMCEKYNLKLVIDLHKTIGFDFDARDGEDRGSFFTNETYQEYFYALWCEIARRFGMHPDKVVFELLNEVTEARYIDPWNRISCEAVRRIHAIAPDSLVLIGGYRYNNVTAVSTLAAPVDDKVVYNFHSYDPFPFTHQGASWVDSLPRDVRISYEESGATEEFYEQHFADAIKAAADNNTTLYCGEYGLIDHAKPEDLVKWVGTIGAVFARHKIPHALWTYKQMSFGLIDPRLDGVRDELVRLL